MAAVVTLSETMPSKPWRQRSNLDARLSENVVEAGF
jgi:hypothetical protein